MKIAIASDPNWEFSLKIWAPPQRNRLITPITLVRLGRKFPREGPTRVSNKVPRVRAAVAWTEETARLVREHNDANVLSLGARITPSEELPKIVRAWFNAKSAGGRHAIRVEKIREIEQDELANHAIGGP